MNSLLATIVWLADPSQPPGFDGDENLVTPGVIGFVVTFFIAVATVLLILDMTRRIRRTRYREEIREKLADEQGDDAADGPSTGPAGS